MSADAVLSDLCLLARRLDEVSTTLAGAVPELPLARALLERVIGRILTCDGLLQLDVDPPLDES